MTNDNALHVLDNWKFWVGVAYFGLAGCIVALFVIFGRQATETARREAISQASNQAQVTQCYQSVDGSPGVVRILDALNVLVTNSVTSSRNALAASDKNDPLNKVREASIARLLPAQTDVRKFIKATRDSTPTLAKCNRLAKSIGIPPRKPVIP